MEGGEVGAQVAPPILLHQPLSGRFHEIVHPPLARKRDLTWATPNYSTQNHQQIQQLVMRAAYTNPPSTGNSWNCKMWDWDSAAFVAKPSSDTSDGVLSLNNSSERDQRRKGEENHKGLGLGNKGSNEGLALKLGGGPYVAVEEQAVRPNKRVRSGSPGSGGNYPMCQVDNCKADLSSAKDYHRRHKVCEFHSKTTKALVGKQMQRFCQQCSRFHPLSEFDEGKRSCRRRLAGHNRRRRKVQADDASSRMLLPVNQDNGGNGSLDLVNILSMLTRLQGNGLDKLANLTALPDKDRLVQLLGKINAVPAANSKPKPPVSGGFDLNVQASEYLGEENERPLPAPSTTDLLTVLSAALKSSTPESTINVSQGSSGCSDDDKVKMNCSGAATDVNSRNQMTATFSPGARNTQVGQSTFNAEHPIQQTRSSLPLQLFNSPENGSPPKVGSSRKYLSSESSNPMEEVSPSSSPPVAQKLFPVHSGVESLKNERISMFRADTAMIEASTSQRWNQPSDVVKYPERRTENQAIQSLPYQAGGYMSSSGSDHSPSSSNSDAHNRTGRITLKLFGKDPSNFPENIKTQILNWLSHIPTEMESYIRPGCVVLSVYLSLSSSAWDDLQDDLLQRIHLLQCSDSDFWSGRFLIRTDCELASYKDGKIRLCKTWKTWSSPELKSVSPLAVVSGKETTVILRGRNLTVPGTKIHCTYMGGYTTKEVLCSAYPGTVYDDSSTESFLFPGQTANLLGRCFIEVENGFKGNSFPIIVADESICEELRVLESELDDVRTTEDVQAHEERRPTSREDILHFLNELGWLFQRSNMHTIEDFSCTRFKFLLVFATERDWSSLVKKLLDIFAERSNGRPELISESLEALVEIQLLIRAVKRKCRKMVDMLLHYSVESRNASKTFLFLPNQAGPCGITPLHLAASTQDSQEIVDALTNDPQELGLSYWNTLLDENNETPFGYASMKNHNSYNKLVARKLADRRNGQVSITVDDEEASLDKSWIVADSEGSELKRLPVAGRSSCNKCAFMESRRKSGTIQSQGLLRRPYIHSMLAIAAVCVCVCLILRGAPQLNMIAPFKWENLDFGPR